MKVLTLTLLLKMPLLIWNTFLILSSRVFYRSSFLRHQSKPLYRSYPIFENLMCQWLPYAFLPIPDRWVIARLCQTMTSCSICQYRVYSQINLKVYTPPKFIQSENSRFFTKISIYWGVMVELIVLILPIDKCIRILVFVWEIPVRFAIRKVVIIIHD